MTIQYGSSAASLFTCIARQGPVVEVDKCPKCGSTDTKPEDHELGLLRCTNCGKVFVRAAPVG